MANARALTPVFGALAGMRRRLRGSSSCCCSASVPRSGNGSPLVPLPPIEDVRRWQVKDFGGAILAVLDEVAPWSDRDEQSYQQKYRRWASKRAPRKPSDDEE